MEYESFNSNEITKLGFYVYLYSHPLTDEIFYVGKGKGNRVFAHLEDKTDSEKVRYIETLTNQGLKPKIEILIHGLDTDEDALKIESSIIDLIGIKNLTNIQKGYKSSTYGRMTVEQVKAAYNKTKIDIIEPSILIRISKAFRHSMKATELYDYTRGYWVINVQNASRAKYAFSIYEGIIQEVYEIAGWYKAGKTLSIRENKEYEEINEAGDYSNRYEFVGNIAEPGIRDKYRYKYIGHLFKKGNSNPVMYLNMREV